MTVHTLHVTASFLMQFIYNLQIYPQCKLPETLTGDEANSSTRKPSCLLSAVLEFDLSLFIPAPSFEAEYRTEDVVLNEADFVQRLFGAVTFESGEGSMNGNLVSPQLGKCWTAWG